MIYNNSESPLEDLEHWMNEAIDFKYTKIKTEIPLEDLEH